MASKAIAVLVALGLICRPAPAKELVYKWLGEHAGSAFGRGLDGGRDVDGDGVPDVIVGSNGNDTPGLNAGRAYLYSGATGALLLQVDGQTGDHLGPVALLDDLDGDGQAEFLVGAGHRGGPAGSAMGNVDVYSGALLAPVQSFLGEHGNNNFGTILGALDDLDGDGTSDYWIYANYTWFFPLFRYGKVYLYSGRDHSSLGTLLGEGVGHSFGSIGSRLGDINGDGLSDFILGSGGAKRVYVYRGGPSPQVQYYFAPLQQQFNGVGRAGDLDQDGSDDFLIGDTGTTQRNGIAYAYSGASGSLLYQWDGIQAGDLFGSAPTTVGDVNGDGYPDILIGSPSQYASRLGHAYLYSGRTGALLYRHVSAGKGEAFGNDSAAAGDVDGDGLDDYLISSVNHKENGVHVGGAFLYSGSEVFLQADPATPSPFDVLELATRGGPPGRPAGLVLRSMNQIPTFQLIATSLTNDDGDWTFPVTVPPGLAGTEACVQSFVARPPGSRSIGLALSHVTTVTFDP